MKKRMLGTIEVGAIGMGCMGFSHAHGDPAPREECIKMMRTAHELGVTLYDTADAYGNGHNEILVGEALKPIRAEVVILTKFNPEKDPLNDPDASLADQIEKRLDASLRRLDTDVVDIYMCHRIPEGVPIEETAEAMSSFIKKGKIRSWAMSRADADQIERGNAIAPVSVIQNEFSMMERSPLTDGTLEACAKHGIGFTPYMPLASGFLSGQFKPGMTYKNDDIHRTSTWFTDENLKRNQPVLTMIDRLASEKNATYSQIALAYLMHKYDRLVPIPGMYEMRFVKENIRAAEIELTAEDMQFIDSTLDSLTIYGDCKEDKVYALGDMLKEEGYVIGKSWENK